MQKPYYEKKYQILKWDSAFWSCKVAKILPPNLKDLELGRLLQYMSAQNISLVYWATDSTDNETQYAAIKHGGFFASKKVTYLQKLNINNTSLSLNVNVKEYTGQISADLENLALQAGIYSRFNIDPGFPGRGFEKLYKIWIQNSITNTKTETVLCSRKGCEIVGMITVRKKNCVGYIGLLAVDESMRGCSIGSSLVYAAVQWAGGQGLRAVRVITQGDNAAACNLYEKCGFSPLPIEHYYHFRL